MQKSDTRILVVDDDRRLLGLLEDTLSTIGYSTTSVTCGPDALTALSEQKHDLLITDINMPKMDGFALLQKVKYQYPKLPVIFITGINQPDFIGKANPEGFLAKPFRISNLEELIEKTLAGQEDKIDASVRSILIIDDDDYFREMLVEALKVCQYTALSASTPKQALKILEDTQIDAVISDIKMPVMDGITLAKVIKEKYPELPIILITAYRSFEQFSIEKHKNVADGILQKPFGLELILDMLDKVIGAPQGSVKETNLPSA